MAKTVQDQLRKAVGDTLGGAAKGVASKGLSSKGRGSKGLSLDGVRRHSSDGALSGAKGVAAGAGAAALVPLAVKGVGKLVGNGGLGAVKHAVTSPGEAVGGATSKVGDRIGNTVKDSVSQKVDEAGGPSGLLKDGLKSALPFGGGDSGDKGGTAGVGKGRRMPVQQSVDIAVPIATAYNQWTQFEQWPEFMHRVTRVTQDDDCTVSFATKIWGKTKEFTAEIETQRPEERIKWHVTNGITHTGVVTFHELAPRLTRIELGLDVEPGGMLEKAARGMRHIKRAARADLHRFKAYIEMQETETGAWRGTIEDGEVVESGEQQRASRGRASRRSSSSRSRGSSGSSRSQNGGSSRAQNGRSSRSSSRQSSRNGSSASRSGSRGRS